MNTVAAAAMAAFAPGDAGSQTARGGAAALAAVVIIALLLEREVLASRRTGTSRTLAERLTVVVIPLAVVLAILVVARLRSYM